MQSLALERDRPPHDDAIRFLLADDDAALRSMIVTRACDAVESLHVCEAADGAEAVQVGLQFSPRIALLDVEMPRLGGIEVASVLRALVPQLQVALYTGSAALHRERARELGLPLFDKLDLEHVLRWLQRQARSRRMRPVAVPLECAACGYGIACAVPPERCPMCQLEDGWVATRRHALTRAFGAL
jgi:CheY-like chemotaxis protein